MGGARGGGWPQRRGCRRRTARAVTLAPGFDASDTCVSFGKGYKPEGSPTSWDATGREDIGAPRAGAAACGPEEARRGDQGGDGTLRGVRPPRPTGRGPEVQGPARAGLP